MAEQRFTFRYIPLDQIDVSDLNVRKTKRDEGLEDLAESIRKVGIQQPIVVFQDGQRFKLIIGQRRYLASKRIGQVEIPALIIKVSDTTEATLASFSENIHRLDLDYKDKMQVATELLSKLRSVDEVARRLGVSPQTVRNYLGYAAVPEPVKQLVSQGKLSASTASRIARNIPDESKAFKIAEKVSEVPRSEDKIRIIEVARENPRKSVADVVRIAEKTKFVALTLDLTPRIAAALERASSEYKSEREDIVTWALEEWLAGKGFLG